jgi:hypothetical protein
VFIPTTPNPTSGFIVMVPRSQAIELEMSIDAAMKMIVTLGVVVPPAPAPLTFAPHSPPHHTTMRTHYCGQVNEQLLPVRASRSPAGCTGGAITAG